MAPDTVGPHADLLSLLAVLTHRAFHPPSGPPATRGGTARRAGMSTGHLSDVLNGRKVPRPETARRLAEALGATPEEATRAFHLAESAQDSMANARTARRIRAPRMLKPAPTGFVGRPGDLAALSAAAGVEGRKAATRTLTVVSGQPGVGKTWLLLHWAHGLTRKWPDGQLYADLREVGSIGEVLHRFLFALGVPPRSIPEDVGDQTIQYHELTAGRRLLVALDNVTADQEIGPLLPGDGPSTVVVTSRHKRPDLLSAHNARILHLDVLTDAESHELLASRVGRARVDAEPDAVRDLIRRCGGLPLALSVIAARAAVHATWPLAQVVERLFTSDTSTIFSSSYAAFDPPARLAFRTLGLGVGVDIELEAAASLLGRPEPETRVVLTELGDAGFLEEPVRGRFRMHELMRSFAAERAVTEVPAGERAAAERRLADFYLGGAYQGERLLSPERPPIALAEPAPGVVTRRHASADAALRWFGDNDGNLPAVQELAAERGWHTVVWQLAWSLDNYQYRCGLVARHDETWQRGLAAAERAGDPRPLALARLCLGNIRARQGRHREALALLEPARVQFATVGDRPNLAQAHRALGFAWEGRDAVRQLHHTEEALRLFREVDNPSWVAIGLNALGETYVGLGRHQRAELICEQALDLHRRLRNRSGEAATLDSLGIVAEASGRLVQAAERYAAAAAVYRELRNLSSEANTLTRLGHVLLALAGREEEGRSSLLRALVMYAEQGRAADADRVLGLLAVR
ncbi:ATP-binding protein [Paractinoplanes globisporus]|uniref:ATP-binding protein n=1 Tax=Paractinoplanes globisporus TaxID=113565 RepID=A0ABW6WFT8_9ACTN|nr:helix-turn-helix domain-containing protein [Actinoplanes globisporus]